MVPADRVLGADVHFHPQAAASKHVEDRVRCAVQIAAKISALHLPLPVKSNLLATQSGAIAFYGTEVTKLSKTQSSQLQAAAIGAIWDPNRPTRCKEILLTLLSPGHRVDPAQAVPFRRLVGFIRILQRRPDLHGIIKEIVSAPRSASPCGPIQLALEALEELGWTWTGSWCIVSRNGVGTDLLAVHERAWAHDVRAAARGISWRTASQRRQDMYGIAIGIDREATNAAWQATSGFTAGVLRGVIAGAIVTEDRLFRGKSVSSPICPYCSAGVVEDVPHLWWSCTAWSSIRDAYPDISKPAHRLWPCCFEQCGIMTVNLDLPPAERLALAGRVQHMMADILLARDQMQCGRTTTTSPPGDLIVSAGYPWGWDPPGPRLSYAAVLNSVAIPRRWPHGNNLFQAFTTYLGQLKWPLEASSRGITYIELAVDFELAMGVDLPCAPRHRGISAPVPIGDRALAFSNILRHVTEHLGTLPHAGRSTRKIRSLVPFGLPVGAGLSARPILLAGSATEAVLRQLHTVPHHTYRGRQLPMSGPARWSGWAETFCPVYPVPRPLRPSASQQRSSPPAPASRPHPRPVVPSPNPQASTPSPHRVLRLLRVDPDQLPPRPRAPLPAAIPIRHPVQPQHPGSRRPRAFLRAPSSAKRRSLENPTTNRRPVKLRGCLTALPAAVAASDSNSSDENAVPPGPRRPPFLRVPSSADRSFPASPTKGRRHVKRCGCLTALPAVVVAASDSNSSDEDEVLPDPPRPLKRCRHGRGNPEAPVR